MLKYFLSIIAILAGLFFVNATSHAQGPDGGLPTEAVNHIPVCPPGPNDSDVRCHARVVTGKNNKPNATTSPTGLSPIQFQTAYGVVGSSSSGKIVAIVDAYDDPTAKSDLDTFSSQFGLPVLPTCSPDVNSSSEPCFQKVDQNGGTNYPAVNSGWALEISLDIQTVHTICPDCKILLVEASSNSYADLMAGVDRAVAMHATAVSNSYGSNEFSSEIVYDSHFNHPGTAFTFSSGDNGYGTSYPAASRYVTAVGGTSLYVNLDNTYNHESVWSGTGSGCSNYESKPSFQHDSGCFRRTIADVSADADPNTGASVYDTTAYSGQTGWFQVGGTSLASPIVASVYALGGISSGIQANSLPYGNVLSLHDVTTGRNGNCRRSTYLCTGGVGYDGPTGLGTPKGLGAF